MTKKKSFRQLKSLIKKKQERRWLEEKLNKNAGLLSNLGR